VEVQVLSAAQYDIMGVVMAIERNLFKARTRSAIYFSDAINADKLRESEIIVQEGSHIHVRPDGNKVQIGRRAAEILVQNGVHLRKLS
jgi:hypothetical protein